MPLPSTGWLPSTIQGSGEVLPALLPKYYIGKYIIGTSTFDTISDPQVVSEQVSFGDSGITANQGISSDGLTYGLIVSLIRRGVFGSVLLDTLTIPEVTLKTIIKEVCPPPFDKVVETCPETVDEYIEEVITNPTDNLESPVAILALDDIELPCGVLNLPRLNGLFLLDGSLVIA
jgi:hypothetical protein